MGVMPEAKAFQSKLVPFYDLIARLRKKHVPYPEIAKRLHEEHGLKVAPSTIFAFVKVRARRSGVFALPEHPASATSVSMLPAAAASEIDGAPQAPARKPQAVDGGESTPTAAPTPTARKEYVFIPKPKRPSIFSDEDMQLNDPLAFDTHGKSVPVDPDAKNPFKTRKREAS